MPCSMYRLPCGTSGSGVESVTSSFCWRAVCSRYPASGGRLLRVARGDGVLLRLPLAHAARARPARRRAPGAGRRCRTARSARSASSPNGNRQQEHEGAHEAEDGDEPALARVHLQDGAAAMSLASRAARRRRCPPRRRRPSSWAPASTSSGHFRSNSSTYFCRSLPTICVVLLIFTSLEARVVRQRGRDGLRVGDRARDAAHHDVPLLHVELLDVVLHRRRDRLREAHHHVEAVGVRHRVLVAQRGLLREQVLRLLRRWSPRCRAPPW